jgi:3-oxoacyl-(acyl-carrier-protein) synthase
MRRVVVTGLGVVSPSAHGVLEFERALREGRSGIRFIPELEALGFSCRIAGVPQDFDRTRRQYFRELENKGMNETIAYAAVAAIDAWRDARLSIREQGEEPDWDTGTILGCGVGDMSTIASEVVPAVNAGKVRRLGSRVVERVMNSGPSARVAGILGLGNQSTSNSSACNTGTEAIVEGVWKIRTGRARRILAGGTEGGSPYVWSGFDSMRVLAKKFNDRPEEGSRPMSASAAGFVPGCGAAVLVLEDLLTARERGARIYAEILGVGVNCGGQRQGGSMTAPNHAAARRCIRDAVRDAGISAGEIDTINGHLSATFADPYEVMNWSLALERPPAKFPYINATKSMIGHCLGAAGAMESVAVVLELHKGFVHPSINCEDLHRDLTAFEERIPRECLPLAEMRIAIKASFGFGDVNSCVVFRKWQE